MTPAGASRREAGRETEPRVVLRRRQRQCRRLAQAPPEHRLLAEVQGSDASGRGQQPARREPVGSVPEGRPSM